MEKLENLVSSATSEQLLLAIRMAREMLAGRRVWVVLVPGLGWRLLRPGKEIHR